MIEYLPEFRLPFHCINCGSDKVIVREVLFQGIHTLADCVCGNCGGDFFHTLPIGHDLEYPTAFSKNGEKQKYSQKSKSWLSLPLIRSMLMEEKIQATINAEGRCENERVVILNCLDNCFGHIFTKLWNVQLLASRNPSYGIIVIVPLQLKWLVPSTVEEIWTIDSELKKLDRLVDGLDMFIKLQVLRFRHVALSEAYVHLDTSQIDLGAFLKTRRFDLSFFNRHEPCITFCLREDRFWLNSRVLSFVYKASIKFKATRYLKFVFVWRQNNLVNRSVARIANDLTGASFYAVGLGRSGTLISKITDQRVTRITQDSEQGWNEIYSRSHLVVGVHGSNMLIPTALAAGFINIVPRHKIDHITEDTALPYRNRYLQFLGRHLDEFSSARLVAMHAISMIRNFTFLYKNTEQEL